MREEIKKVISPALLYLARDGAQNNSNAGFNENKKLRYKNIHDNCNRLLLFIDREGLSSSSNYTTLIETYERDGKIDKHKSIKAICSIYEDSLYVKTKKGSDLNNLFEGLETLEE